jgi:hypothetical protein
MAISESQLETWAKQGATAQFTSTYSTLSSCLSDTQSPYSKRDFSIFLQGSYKNDTNIYADSDVDLVIRLNDVFYSDLANLPADDQVTFNAAKSDASYNLHNFRSEVLSWLITKYGADVVPGKKAIFVKGNGNRRDADVLPCAKLRRYYSFKSWTDQRYVEGIRFFLPDNSYIDNFPNQHHDNCTTKHQNTNSWFKRTVRAYKNLRNTMIDKNIISADLAPSYFLEGLLYNVPNERFGGSHQLNFKDTLDWLIAADRSKFECANGLYYLLHPTSLVTWRAEKCDAYLKAAKKYWDDA